MSNSFKKIVTGISTVALAMSMVFVAAPVADAATAGGVYKTTDGTVWFVTDSMQRRPFTSWGAFLSYGFLSASQIMDADASVTALPSGSFIAPQDGRIFCATETKGTDVSGECSLITMGKKAAFTSAAVFTGQGYSFARAFYGDSSFLEKTSNIDNASAQHRPGTLINNNGTVQLVVSGGLWGVPSMDVFNSWGWSFADVVPANSADVLLSQTGIIPGRMAGQLVPTASTSGGDDDNTGNCDDLQGSAGDITVSDSGDFSSEEVGEDEEEVPVYSFEVEADNDSDVAVTSVKVELMQGTGADSEDIEDYIDSVQIMRGDDVVGEVDADEFNEDSDVYSKNISLDCAFVGADESEDFTIAVTSIENIDGSDLDTAVFNIGVSQIRFEDADGVSTTESFTLDVSDDTIDDTLEEQFTFGTFASANDVELKVALGTDDDADEINEAHVLDIDDNQDTDELEILAFTLEAEGSDINVSEIPVKFTTVEATGNDPDDLLNRATLWMGTTELASESFTGVSVDADDSVETIVFEDLDIDIDEDDTAEFTVTVDAKATDTSLDNGDTVKAELTTTEVDAIEAEDETGEELAAADLTGSASGEASAFYDAGIMVELVSKDVEVAEGDPSATLDSDLATFTFVFDVTAFDGDAHIDNTDPALTGGGTAHDLTLNQGAGTVVDSDIESDDDSIEGTNSFLVEEGTTERFTITAIITPTADGLFQLDVDSILYAPEAAGDVDGTIDYTFDMDDFRSTAVYLNNDAA
jgi:hypothetical protein